MSTDEFEERVVTVPLRDATDKPKGQRADFAIRLIADHLAKHFSVEEEAVRLDPSINETVWEHGRTNPPSKLRVRAARFVEDGDPIVEAEAAE